MSKQEKSNKNTVIIIAGPTAGGKSAHALELAAQRNGVIINCDSMQIYEGLPILTAQPPEEDLKQADHRLYSHLHPNDICSAGNWRELAEPLIAEILDVGKTPIVCGGSGLYIKALMEGLSPMPDIPNEVRDATVALQKELGNPGFYEELKKRDPEMAQRFHPFHTARLLRAWEVLEATGISLAEWQRKKKIGPPDHWEFDVKLIMPERDVLYQRCNDRFLLMIKNGALEEVEDFGKREENGEINKNIPLRKALGYRELLAYIKGDMSKDDAVTAAQNRTRRYAKQQVTWFRNQV